MSLSLLQLAAVGGAGLLAGAINAIAGGGTLLTFPMLMGAGLSPISANVTNTVALTPGYLGGTYAQRHDLEGQRNRARNLAIPAILGGVAGGAVLLLVGNDVFRALVPWLILIATVLFAARPYLRRWELDFVAHHHITRHPVLTPIVAFIGAVYGGFFGAALGIILMALYGLVIPDTLLRINVLKQLTEVLANGCAAVLFAFTGLVAWDAALVLGIGALVGGVFASRHVHLFPQKLLHRIVVGFGSAITVWYFIAG